MIYNIYSRILVYPLLLRHFELNELIFAILPTKKKPNTKSYAEHFSSISAESELRILQSTGCMHIDGRWIPSLQITCKWMLYLFISEEICDYPFPFDYKITITLCQYPRSTHTHTHYVFTHFYSISKMLCYIDVPFSFLLEYAYFQHPAEFLLNVEVNIESTGAFPFQ